MKTTKLAVAAFLLFVGEAFAASAVSDVIARQRWPWSGKVDIDYTVTGDTTDVDFTATWDGQPLRVRPSGRRARGQDDDGLCRDGASRRLRRPQVSCP